ncbi:Group 1 glycosyl transferase [Vibrio chagasii]|nr:Group 1 glycosyl transferase [Vibrio chagasii]
MKKNVAFFVSGLDQGGLETYLLRFLTCKCSDYNNIYIFCKSGKGGQLEKDYSRLTNVNIVKVKLGYVNFLSFIKVIIFLIKNRVDVVCDFTGNFSGPILACAKISKTKNRVAFYRGSTDHFERSTIKSLYNYICKKLVIKFASNILSNSKAAFDYFHFPIWKRDKRFSVIYNGIDSALFLKNIKCLRKEFGIPKNSFVVGHTGRYNIAKNHSQIINIAIDFVQRHQDAYFILCGNGVELNLKERIESEGLSSKILVFENRNDIPSFLNTMDCYFFPSLTEGQPNALIEAMIMGLPFVASDIPPIRETVGEYCNLYDPVDFDELIGALDSIYFKRPVRDELLKNEACKRFDYKENFHTFGLVLES